MAKERNSSQGLAASIVHWTGWLREDTIFPAAMLPAVFWAVFCIWSARAKKSQRPALYTRGGVYSPSAHESSLHAEIGSKKCAFAQHRTRLPSVFLWAEQSACSMRMEWIDPLIYSLAALSRAQGWTLNNLARTNSHDKKGMRMSFKTKCKIVSYRVVKIWHHFLIQ